MKHLMILASLLLVLGGCSSPRQSTKYSENNDLVGEWAITFNQTHAHKPVVQVITNGMNAATTIDRLVSTRLVQVVASSHMVATNRDILESQDIYASMETVKTMFNEIGCDVVLYCHYENNTITYTFINVESQIILDIIKESNTSQTISHSPSPVNYLMSRNYITTKNESLVLNDVMYLKNIDGIQTVNYHTTNGSHIIFLIYPLSKRSDVITYMKQQGYTETVVQ